MMIVVVEWEVMRWKGEREPVLVLLSDLYSELDLILISANKPFISSALYYLLTTYSTDYCSNQIVNYFDLRRSFYTRQGLKNTCILLHI